MYAIISLLIVSYLLETPEAVVIKLKDAVDLTWPFNNDTIYWPDSQEFVFTKKLTEVRPNGNWYASNDFCSGEHGGTHFDAPYHFSRNGWKVGEVPLQRLIARGVMIDLRSEVEVVEDKTLLLPRHILFWENQHGCIPDNSVLLVRFGWSKYYGNKTRYLGIDLEGNKNFPGISYAAAQWIVNSGKIVGVGVDTASIDAGSDLSLPAHTILSAHQIYGLENIKFPPIFPENNFMLYVMPMKIEDGTGAPLRLIATPIEINVAGTGRTPWCGHVIVIISFLVIYLLYFVNWSQ